MSDDDPTLHPLVRQMVREGTRDKPLTMNWAPTDRDAFEQLGLGDLTKPDAQILAEALVAGDRFISYSRRCVFYTQAQRYYRPTYSYRNVVPAIDRLAAAGVVENEKVPSGHRGFQSRFRATPELLKECRTVEVEYRPLELIVLRDADGNPIEYRDNRETRAMRKRLIEINEGLTSQKIALGGRIIREGDHLDNGGRAQIKLHRVFHRGSFDLGGRFYGGHWQNIPKEGGRDRITINGEPTAELDYQAMHIRLLYQEWRGDLYAIAQGLVRAAKARHPHIAWALASDAGVRLMRRDSELAERVMFEAVQAIGIVPLAVHDSFIVPPKQKELVMETMENAINSGKTPCGNRGQFRDNVSRAVSTTSPKTFPQYGTDTEMRGEGALRGGGGMVERVPLEGRAGELDSVKHPTVYVRYLVDKLPSDFFHRA